MSQSLQAAAGAVIRLAQAGRTAEARREADALVARAPADPAILHLAGAIAGQSGDPTRAAELLGRALRAKPDDQAIAGNLARALIDSGQSEALLKLCAERPSLPGAQRFEAEALKALGRHSDAAARYRRLAEAQPGDFQLWNNLGTSLLADDDAAGATAALERARALQPNSAIILVNLARAHAVAGGYDQALAAAEAAARAAPGDAQAALEYGRALNRVGRHEDAIRALGEAARFDRQNPEILTLLGQTFTQLADFDRAEQGYRLAIAMPAPAPQAWLNLAVLLEQSNRVDDLNTLVADAEARGVGGGELAYMRALNMRRAGAFADALALLQASDQGGVDDVLWQQLLGQAADRVGAAETAFAAFTAMNDAMRREPAAQPFDGTEHRQYVERLQAMTTPAWVASWPQVRVDTTPPAPVFLVGFPRSGTTLLDTVLMSHPDTHVLEEEPVLARLRDEIGDLAMIPEQGEEAVNQLRDLYFHELARLDPAPPGKLVIDKLPLNILRAPLAHRIFPDARFIFASRHPCDCVLSCFMQNFRVNQAMASFLTLENAALFYDRVLQYWTTCTEVMPLNVHVVRYEDMVADLEGELRPLLDFLGLPWTDDVLDYRRTAGDRGYIRTPSYAQVTERIYARARGRWESYRDQMAPVLPILAPWAERLGYGALTDTPAAA
jgi:Flp pilus assembly protein TadD